MGKEKLTVGMDDATFERLVVAMKRNIFLAGLCMGASVGGLVGIGAYGALGGLVVLAVVYVAVRGWPWED